MELLGLNATLLENLIRCDEMDSCERFGQSKGHVTHKPKSRDHKIMKSQKKL